MAPTAKDRIPAEVQDFIALPIRFPPMQPSYPRDTTHYLYLRQNAPRIPTDDTPKELFVVNAPTDATARNLRRLFAEQLGGGRVQDVEFEDASVRRRSGIKAPAVVVGKKRKRGVSATGEGEAEGEEVGLLPDTWDREAHRSGGTAVVRFVDQTSAVLALREARRAAKAGRRITWAAAPGDPPLGGARYAAHHALRYPDPALLQESTDAYMSAFAAREAEAARQLARQRVEPDEDGFLPVVRGGRNGPARPRAENRADGGGGEVVGGKKKKKQHKGHVEEGFYRFQLRERKKREHGELARKFDEDARRVEAMRRRRGKVRPE